MGPIVLNMTDTAPFDTGIVEQNTRTLDIKDLTEEEQGRLEKQNSRTINEFQATKLEREAKKNWDLFYKVILWNRICCPTNIT